MPTKPPAPTGSPKSRDDHMARLALHKTQAEIGKEFGKHRTTVGRALRKGFTKGGSAKS